MTWTKVVANKFPHDHTTSCCSKRTNAGEIVITVPVFQHGNLVATGVIHSRCLLKFLNKVPDDLAIVEQKVATIKETFVR
jgi:hypothetical protein